MEKDEVLQTIRSGAVHVTMSYVARTGNVRCVMSTKDSSLISDEFLEAFKALQGELAVLILGNSVEVCPDPEGHRSSYRLNDLEDMICDACATLRREQLSQVAEDAPAIFDLREKKHTDV